MIRIKISKTLEQKIRRGYPWVFHYQVQNVNIKGKAGDLTVDVAGDIDLNAGGGDVFFKEN